MCVSPNTLADGTQTACHKCWQCHENTVNDYVGRCIAETKTATSVFSVTLTYGRNSADDVIHERAVVLTYSDVQKYLKLLRRHHYKVRYLVAGEFGAKKGRAHWHIVLIFKGKVPHHELGANFMEAHWPHGYSYWQKPDWPNLRYVCKYVLKEMGDDERQGHLSVSKKPPLGAEYFRTMAERYVDQGLAPQTPIYTFPNVRRRKVDGTQEPIPFMLQGRSRELFLEHFADIWARKIPEREIPKSPLIEEFLDTTLAETRRIHQWFADLPPNLTPAHRLDIDIKRARLAELAKRNLPFVVPKPGSYPVWDDDDWWMRYKLDAKTDVEKKRREAEYEQYEWERARGEQTRARTDDAG